MYYPVFCILFIMMQSASACTSNGECGFNYYCFEMTSPLIQSSRDVNINLIIFGVNSDSSSAAEGTCVSNVSIAVSIFLVCIGGILSCCLGGLTTKFRIPAKRIIILSFFMFTLLVCELYF